MRARYPDFGPTLATEKLAIEGVSLSVETVRQLLIGEGLWKAKSVRRPVIHQLRERRARLGELVQIDGSPHDWFEGRAPKCTLLVFVDDATSRLMYLQFVAAETTFNYFAGVRSYLTEFGKPLAFYSDKFGVFRVNIPNALSGTGLTQFGRALKELDIELICAHSPQAKGRVERANQTLQDRLTKELRLRDLSSLADSQCLLAGVYRGLQCALRRGPTLGRNQRIGRWPKVKIWSGVDALRTAHVIQEPDALLQQCDLSNQNQTRRLHHAQGARRSA